MAREVTLIILGILVALSPYLGLPLKILAILLPVLGLAVASLGLSARASAKRSRAPSHAYGPEEA